MLIRVGDPSQEAEANATPYALYRNRREVLKAMGLTVGAGLVWASFPALALAPGKDLEFRNTKYNAEESLTPFDAVTGYNNFYEFGVKKTDPFRYASRLKSEPWTVRVEGEVANPGAYDFEDLVPMKELEQRVYRMRCVEGWSMIIPWLGVPLATIIKRLEPTAGAKFLQFETLADPQQMPGLRSPVLKWPYVEGLRMDEAMNPLTLIAIGLYGKSLLPQNGAPLRLVVPWKYGFKGIKSIIAMRFLKTQPATSWQRQNRREYGFYSNVNPEVDHPRWSQATERRIGEFRRRKTLMFNGYGDLVAGLYRGMDLKKFY